MSARDEAGILRRPPFGDNSEVGVRGVTTQRSILTAAMAVFAEHGFHDAKVEDIAEAAGCSRPAVYQYFASKEDVFWRLAGHLGRELAELVDRLPEITADAAGVAALDQWLDALVDLHRAYQPVFSSFTVASREAAPSQPIPRALTNRLRQVLPGDAVADATVAVILRGTYYWVLGLFAIPRPRFTRALAATIHRVVHGPLAGVNVDPLVQLSALPAPRWPDAPTDLPLDRTLRSRGVATRQKLLDAAGAVLPRRGFHNTRVDDIAEEAGVSHGSFYRYFASTDDVFRVLALEASAPMAELVDSFPATVGSTPSPALREWLVRWFDVYRSNGGVISAWEEIDFDKPDVAAMSIEVMLVFFDRLVRLVDARGFGDGAVDAIALLAVVERLPYAVVVQRTLDESPAIAAAQHLIERGILGRPS